MLNPGPRLERGQKLGKNWWCIVVKKSGKMGERERKTVDVIYEWPLKAMCDNGIVCRQPENDTIHLESSMQWPFLCTLSDGISFDVRTVLLGIEIVLSIKEMTKEKSKQSKWSYNGSLTVTCTCPLVQRMTQTIWRAAGSGHFGALYLMEFPSTYARYCWE